MITGFSFCGEHSLTDYGVLCRTVRPILADRNRREVNVPGRHGRYDYGGDSYDIKIFKADCFIADGSVADLRSHARRIAAWLQKKGNLTFDDDAAVTYTGARVYTAIDLEQIIAVGKFSVIFECNPIGAGVPHTVNLSAEDTAISEIINVDGTAPAGFVLTLQFEQSAGGANSCYLNISGG